MREPTQHERLVQLALAALLIAPLSLAFFGGGSFKDAFGGGEADPNLVSARHWQVTVASQRSLAVGCLTTLWALLLGVPAGWLLAQHTRPLWLLVLCALPLALPSSVAVSGWIGLLAPENFASRIKGLADEWRGVLFSVVGVSFVLATLLWPIIAFELWPAFRRARNEGYDAALMSSSRTRTFFRIMLPQVRGELAAGALLVFLLAISDFTVSSLLLVRTLPIEIHDRAAIGHSASAAWAALPLLATALVIAVGLARLQARSSWQQEPGSSPAGSEGTGLAVSALGMGVLLGFVLPLAVCLHAALATGRSTSGAFQQGLEYVAVSLRLAGAAALVASLLALLRVVLWPESRIGPLNAAALFLLVVPGSFLAAAILALQQQFGSWAAVLPHGAEMFPVLCLALGYVVRFIYLPLRLVEEGLARLNSELLEAAAIAGHGRLSRGVSIALPLVAPHLFVAAALVFILTLGEVSLAAVLVPPGIKPATFWLFLQQHQGYDENVFALSLLLGLLAAAVLLLAALSAAGAMRLFHFASSTGRTS